MVTTTLPDLYRRYIDCLNTQDWDQLGRYVAEDVRYNGQPVGLTGYRQARVDEFRTIPDLHFHIHLLVADGHTVATRLDFNITPQGAFLGLPVNGQRITFSENVFYQFEHGKIAQVWSVVDKAAVELQLQRA